IVSAVVDAEVARAARHAYRRDGGRVAVVGRSLVRQPPRDAMHDPVEDCQNVGVGRDRQHLESQTLAIGHEHPVGHHEMVVNVEVDQPTNTGCTPGPTWGPNNSLAYCIYDQGYSSYGFMPALGLAARKLLATELVISEDGSKIVYQRRDPDP